MSLQSSMLGIATLVVPLSILSVYQPGILQEGVYVARGAFLLGDFELRSGSRVVTQVKGVSKGGALGLCEAPVRFNEYTPPNLECLWRGERLHPETTQTNSDDEAY